MKGDATSVKHPTITIPPRMTYSSKSIMRHLKFPYEICWVDSSGLDKCYDEGNLHLLDHKLQVDQCFLLHPSLKDRNCLFIEKQYLTWHWYPLFTLYLCTLFITSKDFYSQTVSVPNTTVQSRTPKTTET